MRLITKSKIRKHDEDNVQRGTHIAAGSYVEYNNVRYWIRADEGLQIMPQSISADTKIDIQSMTIDSTDGLTLIVKGKTNTAVPCLKLHTDGNGNHWYGTGASVLSSEGGEFELRFDLTQLEVKSDTPWYWFHIYAYADVEPADNGSYAQKVDLQKQSVLQG